MTGPLPAPDPLSGGDPGASADRRFWMSVLARADAEQIAALLPPPELLPSWRVLRGPESGLVMVRGRAGGGGALFNLGEITVTRCTIVTEPDLPRQSCTGHAYIRGRAARHAELAALADALLQDATQGPALHQQVIPFLAARQAAARDAVAGRAAATKVDFFNLASMRA